MTREEAIKGLKVLRKDFSGYKPNEEMFDMAIEALEQEETLQNLTKATYDKRFDSIPMEQTTEILQLRKDLRELPSAQPERKKGKWIGKYPVTSACSECNYLIHDSKVKVFAYCPNCGADMRGEEE